MDPLHSSESGTDTNRCLFLPKLEEGCSPKPWLSPAPITKSPPWARQEQKGCRRGAASFLFVYPQTPEGINIGNPSFIHARVWIFPQQQTEEEETDKHLHLCSSSFSRESPHLRASSGVGLREKDSALAKRSCESRVRRLPRRSTSKPFPANKAMLCAPAGLAPAPTSAPELPDHLQAEPGSAPGSTMVALLEGNLCL